MGTPDGFEEHPTNPLFNKIFLYGSLLIFLIVTTICVVNAIQWANKPFAGFLLNERMVVAPIGQYHWTGTQADLKYPDKIISANGEPITAMKDLDKVLAKTHLGIPITYEVERGGTRFSIAVPSMRFSWTDLLMTFGVLFFAGFAYMLIGLIVFVMKPNVKVSWLLLIACLFLSMWSITIFDMQSTHFGFIRFYLMTTAFIPAAFGHFSMYFPEPQKFIQKYPKLQIIPWLISFAIFVPMELIYPNDGFQLFYSLALGYNILVVVSVLYPILATFFKPVSVLARQRSKVVLLGAAVAFPFPIVAYFMQMLFGSFMGMRIQTNFLALILILFPTSIAYAIAKHNLFDVDVYIKRAVGYVIMTVIIVCAYLGISIPLNVIAGQYEIADSQAFPILFTLGVILIFNPMYTRVQTFVDRIFFRKEYDYSQIVDKISGAITSEINLSEILKRLVATFIEEMFIDTSSVMLLDSAGSEYQVYMADGEKRKEVEQISLNRSEPLVKIIEETKQEVTKYDVLEDPKYMAVSKNCEANFSTLHASLMIPMVFQKEVIGFLNLGEKKSGKFFNREDIDILNTIAKQGAVAIENARLFQENLEKQRMEEELAIGRELQMSMLPAECPQIDGFEIAAFSESAREVGGDFYDFIEISHSKLGIVVGDVTGKSVSGALVMSASRSIFRMLGENELTVNESMIRANRRTKKDIKTGMFVALLYAVIDSNQKELSLCSAGQTQPVYRSAASNETTLVQTEGDTFPLGILDEANYEETELRLNPGDRAVLYTDGIVEAMNAQDEMFGFDRLLEAIQESKTLTAQSLLDEIKGQVNEFTAGAPQHDDITIIVIQAV